MKKYFIVLALFTLAACGHAQLSGKASTSGKVTLFAPDTTAPTISNVASSPTSTTALITFTTNEVGSTQICRGAQGGPYSTCNSEIDTSPRVTSHSDTFTSLSASTTYYYVVKSTDASGNTATSSEQTVTTSAGGGGGVLDPTCGSASSTGASGNGSRPIMIADHWSTTQAKPSLAVGTNAAVGNGSTIVITVGTDPTSGSPRFRVGGRANLDVADASADGNYTITALSSTTITVSSSYNGTTGTGTVKAIMYSDLAEGATLTDPATGCVTTKVINGSVPSYSGWNAINYTNEYYLAFDLTASTFKIIRLSDRAVVCTTSNMSTAGVFGEGASPRWGRTSGTQYTLYFFSFNSNVLKKLSNVTSSCTSTTNVKTFTGYAAVDIGGNEGDLTLSTTGDEIGAFRGCSVDYTCASGTREIFLYNITDDVKGTVRNIAADSPDNYRACPDSKMVYQTGTSMVLLNSDGTTNRTIVGLNLHISSCVGDGAGNYYVVGDIGSNDDATLTTSPDCEPGFVAINVATSAGTCLWNKTNASESGAACNTGSCNLNGHISIGADQAWAILTINDDGGANVNEASLSSSWDTNWDRGSSEVVACKLDGTSCYRLAHLRRGGGGSYRKLPKCSSAMVYDAPAGSAPKYVVCGVDWRDGSGDAGTDTLLITVR